MCPAVGNLFYLVMPGETGESTTDDDPPTPTADHFPESPIRQEVMSSSDGTSLRLEDPDAGVEVEVAGCGGAAGADLDRSDALRLEEEEEDLEMGQSQTGSQSHVIKNVEEIFLTMEGLMSKLQHLKVRKSPQWLVVPVSLCELITKTLPCPTQADEVVDCVQFARPVCYIP